MQDSIKNSRVWDFRFRHHDTIIPNKEIDHIMKIFMSLELQGQPIVNLVCCAQIKIVDYAEIRKFLAKF